MVKQRHSHATTVRKSLEQNIILTCTTETVTTQLTMVWTLYVKFVDC